MSQENVEIVRRVWAAVERQDTEAMFAFYDPDIVWQDHTGALELQDHSYHGHEGVRQFWREWLEPFETFEAHSEAFIDAGDNVVVSFRLSGRGQGKRSAGGVAPLECVHNPKRPRDPDPGLRDKR
jgi:ketosteroid isomerase-like protein